MSYLRLTFIEISMAITCIHVTYVPLLKMEGLGYSCGVMVTLKGIKHSLLEQPKLSIFNSKQCELQGCLELHARVYCNNCIPEELQHKIKNYNFDAIDFEI